MMVLWVDARDLAKNQTRSNSECRSRPCKPQRVFLMMVLWVDARDFAKNQTRSKCTRPSNTTKRFLMVLLQVCMRDLQKPGLVDTHAALKPTLRFLMVVLWGGLGECNVCSVYSVRTTQYYTLYTVYTHSTGARRGGEKPTMTLGHGGSWGRSRGVTLHHVRARAARPGRQA